MHGLVWPISQSGLLCSVSAAEWANNFGKRSCRGFKLEPAAFFYVPLFPLSPSYFSQFLHYVQKKSRFAVWAITKMATLALLSLDTRLKSLDKCIWGGGKQFFVYFTESTEDFSQLHCATFGKAAENVNGKLWFAKIVLQTELFVWADWDKMCVSQTL